MVWKRDFAPLRLPDYHFRGRGIGLEEGLAPLLDSPTTTLEEGELVWKRDFAPLRLPDYHFRGRGIGLEEGLAPLLDSLNISER